MKNENDRTRFGRVYRAAELIATMVCYRSEQAPAFMPPQMQEGLNFPAENLCLLPASTGYPHDLMAAVRETRTTVVVIEPGSTTDGRPTFYFTLILCRHGEVECHRAMRLWVSIDKKLYLVPDLDGESPDGECFVLDRGVRAAAQPWSSSVDRIFGLAHADALLLTR